MAFSYNYSSKESRESQYGRYLQNQNYVDQISDVVRETGRLGTGIATIQSREIQNTINNSSLELRETIIESSKAICYSLENELQELDYTLYDIKFEIQDLSNLVGHGFSLILEELKIANQYLGQIQELLRIPDSQKQRVYHIEKGLMYLRNALRESSDSEFYSEALEEFKKSEVIEEKDFFSLYYIGFIHIKSTKHLDNKVAEKYFRKAARYYLAEVFGGGGTIASNNLLKSRVDSVSEAAKAYLFAAEACYNQQKFSEAIQLAEEAWKTCPGLTRAGFMQSKYLAANIKPKEAAKISEKVIKISRNFYLEMLADSDLISKPEIQDLIEKLDQEAYEEAFNLLSECKRNMVKESAVKEEVAEIENLINKKTYIHCKNAIDRMQIQKVRTFSKKGFNDIPSFLSAIKRILEPDEGCKERGYILEKFAKGYLERIPSYFMEVTRFFEDLTKNTQWDFSPQFTVYKTKVYDYSINSNISISVKSIDSCQLTPREFDSSLIGFIKQESQYWEKLPTLKLKWKRKFNQIISDEVENIKKDIRKRKKDIRKRKLKELAPVLLILLVFLILVLINNIIVADETSGRYTKFGTMIDPRDNQTYKTVRLKDGKVWMAENLNFDTGNSSSHYDGLSPNDKKIYGRLYMWEAAQRACPPGWHIPSKNEWQRMLKHYRGYGSKSAYETLMVGGSSGFSAQLGGLKTYYGQYKWIYRGGYYWSSSGRIFSKAVNFEFLGDNFSSLRRSVSHKGVSLSCRCTQD